MSYNVEVRGSAFRLKPGTDERVLVERLSAELGALDPGSGRNHDQQSELRAAKTLEEICQAYHLTVVRDEQGAPAAIDTFYESWTDHEQLLTGLAPVTAPLSWVCFEDEYGGTWLYVFEADGSLSRTSFPSDSLRFYEESESDGRLEWLFHEQYRESGGRPPYDVDAPRWVKVDQLVRHLAGRDDLPPCLPEFPWHISAYHRRWGIEA